MAAPSLDGSVVTYNGASSTPTIAVTVSSNPNRYMKVDVGLGYNSASGVTSVEWNGTPLSLAKDSGFDTSSHNRVLTYELVAPASGTANVVVVLSGVSNADRVCVAVSVYKDVDPTVPRGTAVSFVSDSADPTVDVTSASGETVVDAAFMWDASSTPTVGAGQTQRTNFANNQGNGFLSLSDEAGAATTTMNWTGSAGYGSAIVAFPLKPVSGGGSPALDDSDGFMLTTIQMPLTAVRLY